MCIIILVRHGENEWVKKHRLAGWLPGVHLNENGQWQAQGMAERLEAVPVQALYSSPVTRCMETAEYIAAAKSLSIVQLPDVGEVRYGEWEGKKIKKLAKKPLWRVVQFFPSRMRFPDGETLREVQARAVDALERLSAQHKDETVVVVSHADVIKLVLAHYLGVHIDLFQRIGLAPASVSIISLPDNGMVRVLRLNDDGPLRSFQKPEEQQKSKKKKKKKKDKKTAQQASLSGVPADTTSLVGELDEEE